MKQSLLLQGLDRQAEPTSNGSDNSITLLMQLLLSKKLYTLKKTNQGEQNARNAALKPVILSSSDTL